MMAAVVPCRSSATSTNGNVGCSARIQDQGCSRDHDDAGGDQESLAPQRIGERAPRDQRHRAHRVADRQHQPDRLLRPFEIGQVEGDKGAKTFLDVGDEKIHPIETMPALIG